VPGYHSKKTKKPALNAGFFYCLIKTSLCHCHACSYTIEADTLLLVADSPMLKKLKAPQRQWMEHWND